MGFGKDGKGQILYDSFNFAPGALAALDNAVVPGRYGALVEDFRIIKMDYYIGYTPAAQGDFLLFGIANGELTAQQIEECLESSPLNYNDAIGSEQAGRQVFPLEILGEGSAGGNSAGIKGSENLRWTFANPDGWQYFLYNFTGGPIATGSLVEFICKIYGVWVR